MINVVFCDDNAEFATLLSSKVELLLKSSKNSNIGNFNCRCFSDGTSLISYAKHDRVDVAFLDIDMPIIDGFNVAKELLKANKDSLLIFVSAYEQFVYDVFEFTPIAFIRKSHLDTELERVVSRIVSIIDDTNSWMVFNTTEGKVTLRIKDIVYISCIKNYCYIMMNDNSQYVCRETLGNIENRLSSQGFYRVHAAYIINLQHIQRIDRNISVVMGDDMTPIPISQRRYSGFKKAYFDMIARRLV